ncbi:MAG TPA: hypothetical protein VFW75_04110 [Acetobacteraceae bacterium]|nr:hypothetical protein [Acetobacteraceae bacterium]
MAPAPRSSGPITAAWRALFPADQRPWYHPVAKAVRAVISFVSHAVATYILILLLNWGEASLQGSRIGDLMLVDRWPFHWLFDLIDAGVVLAFGIRAIIDIWKELGED